MKTIIQRLWNAAGLPCRECSGRGYVVDSDVAAFIDTNSLAMWQAATVLMNAEIDYGCLGSLPVSAWEDLGLTEAAAMDFATEVGNCHVLHSCGACHGQVDHPDALKTATSVIRKWSEQRQRARQEWEDQRPKDWRRDRWRNSMGMAIKIARMEREFEQQKLLDLEDAQ